MSWAHGGLSKVLFEADRAGEAELTGPAAGLPPGPILIKSVEPELEAPNFKAGTWLGVSVQELSPSQGRQLGLHAGQGIRVIYVAPGSPADHADLHANDVLATLDDQILVTPVQLGKLVQMRNKGDSVRLQFYRDGQPRNTVARLDTRSSGGESLFAGMAKRPQIFQAAYGSFDSSSLGVAQSLARAERAVTQATAAAGETLEETQRALEEATRQAGWGGAIGPALTNVQHELSTLAATSVAVGHKATILVREDHDGTSTIIQTDEFGLYIILANPKLHLTVRDKKGELLFDGPIETPEEQKKVPGDIWEKIKPLLRKLDRGEIEPQFVMG